MERTCIIIKPDGVCKKLIGEVIKYLESHDLKLVGLKMLKPSRESLEGFYEVHKGKPFFESFMNFITSAPIVVSVWEGNDAVANVRKAIGATNSKEALPGTLRNLYGTDNRRNLVHSSDSKENAIREINYFFDNKEIFSYTENDWIDK